MAPRSERVSNVGEILARYTGGQMQAGTRPLCDVVQRPPAAHSALNRRLMAPAVTTLT